MTGRLLINGRQVKNSFRLLVNMGLLVHGGLDREQEAAHLNAIFASITTAPTSILLLHRMLVLRRHKKPRGMKRTQNAPSSGGALEAESTSVAKAGVLVA